MLITFMLLVVNGIRYPIIQAWQLGYILINNMSYGMAIISLNISPFTTYIINGNNYLRNQGILACIFIICFVSFFITNFIIKENLIH